MEETKLGLEHLEAWKKAKDLAVYVYKTILPLFPADEKYILTSQLKRSVSSISANIAEGHGRYYYQETIRFCLNARGSLEESVSHLTLAHELGFLSDDLFQMTIEKFHRVHQLINGYISYLKKTKTGFSESGHSVRENTENNDELDDAFSSDSET